MRAETHYHNIIILVGKTTQPFSVGEIANTTGASRGTILRVLSRLRLMEVVIMLPLHVYGARHWSKLRRWPEDINELIDKYELLRKLERSTGQRLK